MLRWPFFHKKRRNWWTSVADVKEPYPCATENALWTGQMLSNQLCARYVMPSTLKLLHGLWCAATDNREAELFR